MVLVHANLVCIWLLLFWYLAHGYLVIGSCQFSMYLAHAFVVFGSFWLMPFWYLDHALFCIWIMPFSHDLNFSISSRADLAYAHFSQSKKTHEPRTCCMYILLFLFRLQKNQSHSIFLLIYKLANSNFVHHVTLKM